MAFIRKVKTASIATAVQIAYKKKGRNFDKQLAKAKKALSGQIPANRTKFLTIKTKSTQLNQKLIDKARALPGIKDCVTNLDFPDEEVIAYYHQLFQIEATFRIAKSDLRARPISS